MNQILSDDQAGYSNSFSEKPVGNSNYIYKSTFRCVSTIKLFNKTVGRNAGRDQYPFLSGYRSAIREQVIKRLPAAMFQLAQQSDAVLNLGIILVFFIRWYFTATQAEKLIGREDESGTEFAKALFLPFMDKIQQLSGGIPIKPGQLGKTIPVFCQTDRHNGNRA